jgi:YidC/Oxa1 family membrane protein insertase
MERNAIIATVLVIAILLGYQWYLSQFETPVRDAPPTQAAPTRDEKVAATPSPKVGPITAKPATQPKTYVPTTRLGLAPKDVIVETPLMRVALSSVGARAKSWQLKAYRTDSGAPVELVPHPTSPSTPGGLAAWADAEQRDAVFQADKDRLDVTQTGATGSVTFSHISASGIQMEKRLTFRADHYDVQVDLTFKNLAEEGSTLEPRVAWGPGLRNSNTSGSTAQPPTVWVDGNRVQVDLATIGGEKTIDGRLSWVALQDSFFAVAFLPKDKAPRAFVSKAASDQGVVGLVGQKQTLASGADVSMNLRVYAGPRDLETLKTVGQDLDQLIDLGWFDFLARPALWLLKFLYSYTGNYGIAIILVTVLQKIAFHPLTHKSMKSMQAMQAIQPKVQAIQERYKNNPQKKQEETMALYRKHGVNPMGGCLPMLIQIPIFIALYNALSSSVEMWQARFLWIRDLTQPDSLFTLTLWGGHAVSANLLALLMGVSMWVQQKMTPTAGDPRQAQIMLWTMPVIFTFMFWSFPSGLVLYWFVNNILQVGQQWLINRGAARPVSPGGQPAS